VCIPSLLRASCSSSSGFWIASGLAGLALLCSVIFIRATFSRVCSFRRSAFARASLCALFLLSLVVSSLLAFVVSASAQVLPPLVPGMSISPLTTFRPPPIGLNNFMEDVISNSLAQTGTDVAISGGGAFDAAVTFGEGALETAAVGAGGVAAVGNPVTWAGVAAFAAVGAGVGTYCLVEGCDVQQIMQSGLQRAINLLPSLPLNVGTPLWESSSQVGGGLFVGSNGYSTAQAVMDERWGSEASGCGPYGTQTATAVQISCVVTITGLFANTYPFGELTAGAVAVSNWLIPPGGIPGGGGSAVFDEPSPPPAPPLLDTSHLAPSTGTPQSGSIFGETASEYTPGQLAEPLDPGLIAQVANDIINDSPGLQPQTTGGSSGGFTTGSGPVTSAGVQTAERESGYMPKLSDLFQPVQEGALVTTNPSGVNVPSSTSIANLSTTQPSAMSQTSTQLSNATRCGNIAGGEAACGVTLEMTFNPVSGDWEWMADSDLVPGTQSGTGSQTKTMTNLQTQTGTGVLQQTQTAVQTMTQTMSDTQTKTGTLTQTDTLTDPKTVVQTLTKTQDATEDQTDTPVRPGSPPPFPPIILPFNEWPQVFNDFNNGNGFGSGTCPTVSFTSTTLGNTKFTFASQCLVMDALAPYLVSVLPPTYLLLALFLIMSA
jgi:hypothetical protein